MQDNYIEVIGEAQYSEEPDTWIKDRYKAYKALEKVEELNKISKRIVVQIDERKPFFKASDADILNARKMACKNALIKAKDLDDAFNMDVGSPIEIQEIDKGVRASGNYGDNDWGDVP